MKYSTLLRNPVLQNKIASNMYNPAGSVLEEIGEQEMSLQAGGTISVASIGCDIVYFVASKYLGNHGYVCTLTKECMPSCN
ncbi:plantaricin C family lantibiotic [Paenibacillus sp. FSL R10-2734]|uniref:plantaricin C family lantibiotic n=1 Tax=Paenibacillus sp. FSL R10-2734 TaxID=2954691 RepID=UPI0030DCD733